MRRSETSRARTWPLVALLGAALTMACAPAGDSAPCEGVAVDGAATLKQNETSRRGTPCLVSIYGDSIGTDTSSATTLYSLDSIGTDTSSAAAQEPCGARFVAGGRVVASKTIATEGPCRVKAFFDSIGTDTSTTPPRVQYRFDSIGTDTSSLRR